MNKTRYRIVFNKARGCLMAVAETAIAQGKGASGATTCGAAHPGLLRLSVLGLVCKWLAGTALVCLPLAWLAPSQAQTVATRIVADPTAPSAQRPTVLTTSNGVVQVDIRTPSAAGVSRNTYSQFDVGAAGAVLNNSRTPVQTQQGGWVQGNPWLTTGSARVILNEVNSSNPSYLQGYVEVAGQRAQVIIANPSGIAINGGGFINASTATLTTGTPIMNAGALESFRVQGGLMTIDGQGLDARSTDYTAILSRALQVNAGIWAQQLQVVTGANDIAAASVSADTAVQSTALSNTASAPSYALDVAALGGMYAGKIHLIGTEVGVGVRNAGLLQASSGPLTLSQQGWLSNSGTLQASGGDVIVQTQGTMAQSGTVYSDRNVQLNSQSSQTHSGVVAALGSVQIQAKDTSTSSGGTAPQILASTTTVWVAGMRADGSLETLPAGDTTGGQTLRVSADGLLQTAGQALATEALSLQAASLDVSQSRQQAPSIHMQAITGDLQATGSRILAAQTLHMQTAQTLTTDRAQLQADTLTLQAQALSNVAGQITQTGQADQSLTLQGQLNNTAGTLYSAARHLNIRAQGIDNTAGQILHAGQGTLAIDSQGDLINTVQSHIQPAVTDGARIIGSGAVQVSAQTLTNSGSIYAAQDAKTTAKSLANSGSLYAGGAQTLTVTEALHTSGTIAAAKDLNINAASMTGTSTSVLAAGMAADGQLSGTGTLTAVTTGALQSAGQVLATNGMSLTGSALNLAGSQTGTTAGDVSLSASSGDINTRQAQVSTPGKLTLTANSQAAQKLDNSEGQISAQQLNIRVGQLVNDHGAIEQTGTGVKQALIESAGNLNNTSGSIIANAQDFTLNAGALNNTSGLIGHAGVGKLKLSATSLDNSQGQIMGNGAASITTSGDITNADGLISAAKDLSIQSADLSNTVSGTSQSATGIQSQTGNLSLNTAALTNSGSIYAAQDVSTTAKSLNNNGSLYAGGKQALTVTNALSTSGTIAAVKDLNINAASVAGTSTNVLAAGMAADGKLSGTGALSMNTSGTLQSAGQVLATNGMSLAGSALNLAGSQTGTTAGDVSLIASSGDINTRQAQVSTPGKLTLTANSQATQKLDNSEGQISAQQLLLKLRKIDNNNGSIEQTGVSNLVIDLQGGAIHNTSGSIIANAQNFTVNAGALTNTSGLVGHAGTGSLTLSAASLDNSQGQIMGNGAASITTSGDITNADGLISAAKDLSIQSADLSNTVSGTSQSATGIQSQSGNLSLNTAALTNSGSIYAAQDVSTTAKSLNNSGSLYAGGAQTLTVTEALHTSGTIAAAKDLTIQAQNLNGTSTNVLAAGMTADGQLSGTGTLTVNTSGALQSAGQVLATNGLGLTGSALNLAGSQTGTTAGDVNLTASSGDINTRQAQVSTPGQLSITANSQSTQKLDNTEGQISAQQLNIRVGQLVNDHGAIEQTGTGVKQALIESAGSLNNTSGSIIANAQDFTLNAGALNNTSGLIGHAGVGKLTLSAVSLDNSQGQIMGNGEASITTSADITNADGLISAAKDLSIQSADLSNTVSGTSQSATGIQSQSGNLSLNTATLTNSGSIYAAQDVSTTAKSLNNSGSLYAGGNQALTVINALSSSGTIAAAKDLNINAASVAGTSTNVLAAGMAADGKLSGTGALSMNTSGTLQSAGQVLATNGMSLAGSALNLAGSQTGTTAGDLSLIASSGDINTRQAQLSTPGKLTLTANSQATQKLDNSEGQISAQQLNIRVGQLVNDHGAIEQTGSGVKQALIESAGNLNNTSGSIIANAQDFTLNAGALNNTSGLIGHAGVGKLKLSATSLDNSQGQIMGNGAASITTSGDITNADGLISAAKDLSIQSADLSNTVSGTSQSATGIQSQTGNLSLNTAALTNSGSIYAAQDLSSTANSLANSGSLYAGGNQALTVINALSSSGTIAAAKDLNINAASVAGTSTNVLAAGMAADGQLSGTGTLTAVTTGALQSAGQVLATNGMSLAGASLNLAGSQTGTTAGDLSLIASSGDINTRQAQLSTPGKLTLTANSQATQKLDNSEGQISAQQLNIRVGQLVNDHGAIEQTGTGVKQALIESAGSLNNASGSIIANAQDFTLNAGALNNTSGLIGHAGVGKLKLSATSLDNSQGQIMGNGAASITTSGDITNADGLISAAKDLSIQSADLSNTVSGTSQSATGIQSQTGNLSLNTAALTNSGIVIAAKNLDIDARQLDNRLGTLASTQSSVNITTHVAGLDNRNGRIQAAADVGITVQNTGYSLINSAGRIQAVAGAVNISGGELDNSAGLISAGAQMSADTHGQALINQGSRSQSGSQAMGLVASGDIEIKSGILNTQGGLIQTQGTLNIDATELKNQAFTTAAGQQASLIYSEGGARIAIQSLDNTGSQILSLGDVSIIASDTLRNTGGLVRSAQALSLSATSIDNNETQGLDQGLEAQNVTLAAQLINNQQGAIRASQNLSLWSNGSIDNTDGLLSAAGRVQVAASPTPSTTLLRTNASAAEQTILDNRRGQIVGDSAVSIQIAQLRNDSGQLISKGDVSLALQGDYTPAGQLQAGRDLGLNVSGVLTNQQTLQAGRNLSVSATELVNTVDGQLISGGDTTLNVSDRLTNRGLIDGVDTRITAVTLQNLGTGRIYGDRIAIAADALTNQEETQSGKTQAATIAARQRLDMGVQNLTNREGALLYSAGDMALGGGLDAVGQATGKAQKILNQGASIEAAGQLSLMATRVHNLASGLTYDLKPLSSVQIMEYTTNKGVVYNQDVAWQPAGTEALVLKGGTYSDPKYKTIYEGPNSYVGPTWTTWGDSDQFTPPQTRFAATDPIWATLGLQAPTKDAPSYYVTVSSGDGEYRTVNPEYDVQVQPWKDLQAKIDSLRTNVSSNWASYSQRQYRSYAQTNTTPVVTGGRVGTITAAQNMALDIGAELLNVDSQMIAGGAIGNVGSTTSQKINNTRTSVPTENTQIGKQTDWAVVGRACSSFLGITYNCHDVYGWSTSDYNKTLSSTDYLNVLRYDAHQSISVGRSIDTTTVGTVSTSSQSMGSTAYTLTNQTKANVSTQTVQATAAQGSATTSQAQAGAVAAQTAQTTEAQGGTTTSQVKAAAAIAQTAQASAAQGGTTTSQAQAGAVAVQTAQTSEAQGGTTTSQAQAGAAAAQTAQASAAQGTSIPRQTEVQSTNTQKQVRTQNWQAAVPNTSLYRQHPEAGAKYLVETDPQFTQYKTWLGSDFMTAQLQFDPATTQKRMGDGFYEQKLVREQVQALTGQRFLGDYSNDEAQYKALMNNGLTYANALQLRPGIALSPEQVAQLTTDMVWLVTQDVTLADGSKQSVLVPQVYVRVQPGDVDGTGALLAGRDIQLNLTGDVNNSGTIAGRDLVQLSASNIRNLAGNVSGAAVALLAEQDIDNTGGQIQAQSAALLSAGRDINLKSTTQSASGRTGVSTYSQTGIDRVAGLYVSGPAGVLIASAGRDLNVTAAQISNQGTGQTSLSAGQNLNLSAVTTANSQDTTFGANRYLRTSQSQDVGSQINAAGSLSLSAGQDLNAKAAQVLAGQSLQIVAGQNVNITQGQSSQSEDIARQTKSSGFFSKKTTTTRTSTASTTAVASNLEGASVSITAGQDLTVKGSNVLADQAVNLSAVRNVNIEAAQNTQSSTSFNETKKSGLFSSGGLSLTIGKQQQSLDQGLQQTTAAASTLGSTGGNVTINAGGAFTQTGSDVITPKGDIAITAQKVDITEARETGSQSTEQKFKQSGLTVAITSPVLSALQTASSQLQAAGNTSSGRMQALAGANAAFNLKQGADAIKAGQGDAKGQVPTGNKNPDGTPEMKDANAADKAGGIGISISVGSSSSQSKQSSSADNARGSSINAGGNITIQATRTAGASNDTGKDSNLTVQGSSIQAAGTTTLKADKQVNLLAAQNTTSESSTNQSKSGSVGVAIQLGAGGGGMGFTASASKATGQGAGNSVTYTNTQVAGNTVNIESGGDTTLKGAVVKANQVTADVGGNLTIQSLQDTNQYKESSKSAGGSIMVGAGVSGSVNLAKSSINSNYQSVGEQSAIRAGDGGFQVEVKGNTTLTGAQITSTQAAIDNSKNSFQTGGTLTTTDLQNTASYSAQSASVGVGTSGGKVAPSGAGIGSDKGSASSTSTAGISGIAGNTQARTGDKETGIGQIFDKDKVKAEVNAQVAITSEFGKQASKAVGDYAQKQYDKALASGDQAGIDAWKEGGTNRVALHAVVGGLTGGVQGAVGAGTASAAAPVLDDLQGQFQQGLQKAGLGEDASKLIASVASGTAAAGIGATASGGSVSGGATAFNADMNNRQIGQEERRLAQSLASKAKVSGLTKPDGSAYTQAEIENAMRNSGKGSESITQGMQVDPNKPNAITDKDAVWTSNDGKTLVQVNKDGSNLNPGTIDPKLAAYIVQETGGANTPYKDLYKQVESAKAGPATNLNAHLNTITPAANGAVTAEAAAGLSGVRNPIRDINDIRNDVADGAALVSRGSGIVGSAATTAATVPGPHQPGAATTAVTATVVGFGADVVEQVARPDVGKGVHDFFLAIAQKQIDNKLPLAAPVTNEVKTLWINSGSGKPFETWVNERWSGVVKQLEATK